MLRPGLDLPIVTALSPAPALLVAGECGTCSLSGGRYSYWLYKDGANTKFARFDFVANTWQSLAAPPTGVWAFGATNSIAFDEPNDLVWVYMTGAGLGTARLLRFDVSNLLWLAPIETNVPVLTTATALCVAGRKRSPRGQAVRARPTASAGGCRGTADRRHPAGRSAAGAASARGGGRHP
jgi:hypothetical protein